MVVNHDKWWFLTGNKKEIYDFARHQLFVTALEGDGGPEDFIHTEKIILIDQKKKIRGYYNGLDSASVRQLAKDISVLALHKRPKKR
jgi:protein SCO1/2